VTTKPTYTLLMSRGHDVITWCELDEDEWQRCYEDPQQYQIFVIEGSSVKVLVASYDKSQTQQEALKTASSFVLGRYEKIKVDLKRLIGTKEDGIDHRPGLPHPPY
jgi:hypothetical protein